MSVSATSESQKQWSGSQVWIPAAICFVLGMVLGFFVRNPQVSAAARPTARPEAQAQAGVAQVTPEQLKHMADTQAQPLLAQLTSTPNDPQLLARVGYIYFATRNFKEAAEYYRRSAEIQNNAVIRTELGRAYYYAGDPEHALAEFQNVLKLDPNNANAWFNLGMIKWQAELDPDGAVAAWQQMLKRNPQHPRGAEVEELIARAQQHRGLEAAASAAKPVK